MILILMESSAWLKVRVAISSTRGAILAGYASLVTEKRASPRRASGPSARARAGSGSDERAEIPTKHIELGVDAPSAERPSGIAGVIVAEAPIGRFEMPEGKDRGFDRIVEFMA